MRPPTEAAYSFLSSSLGWICCCCWLWPLTYSWSANPSHSRDMSIKVLRAPVGTAPASVKHARAFRR